MMTCLYPVYLILYNGELLYIKIKQGFSLIYGTNQNLTILTEDSRAALVRKINSKTKNIIQEVVRLFADHRIK